MNNFKKVVTMVLAFAMVLTCVMVTPAQAAGKLNKATASIYAGETVQLKAKVKSVTWGSSNKKVAKVSKTGLVTGVKKGTCTITAKDNKTKTAYKCKVTVKAAKDLLQRIFMCRQAEMLLPIREKQLKMLLMFWMERNLVKRVTQAGQILRMEMFMQ
mgnify:CR=1 FL=1